MSTALNAADLDMVCVLGHLYFMSCRHNQLKVAKTWCWITTTDIKSAEEETVISIDRAREALSGWLYISNHIEITSKFENAVKAQTAVDFNVSSSSEKLHWAAASLYDAVMMFGHACSQLTPQQCRWIDKKFHIQSFS